MIKKVFMFLISMVCIFFLFLNSCDATNEQTSTEVIILIDTSKTMTDGIGKSGYATKADRAKDWAKDIAVFLVNRNVEVTLMGFDGSCYQLFKKQCLTEENYANFVAAVNELNFTGEFTNQDGAIKDVIDNLNNTGKKYIVMISDGELDLPETNNRSGNTIPEEEKSLEKEAESNFQKNSQAFANIDGHYLFLIDMETEVSIFEALKGKDSIIHINGQDNTEVLTKELLKLMEISYSNEETDNIVGENGKFDFTTDKAPCTYIITLISDKELTEEQINKVKFTYEDDTVEPVRCNAENTVHFYIDDSQQKTYHVELPIGNWRYRIRTVKDNSAAIESISLKLMNGDKEVVQKKSGKETIYAIDEEDTLENFALYAEVLPIVTNSSSISCQYYVNSYEQNGNENTNDEDYEWQSITITENGGKQNLKDLEAGVEYTAQVKIKDGQISSNKIHFTPYEKLETVDGVKINENVDILNKFTIFKIKNTSAIKYEIKKDRGVSKEEKDWTITNDKSLVFYEAGSYEVVIVNNNKMAGKISIIVKDNEISKSTILLLGIIIIIIIIVLSSLIYGGFFRTKK